MKKNTIKILTKSSKPKITLLALFLFFLFSMTFLNAQISAPPVPCTDGTQNTCQCENSPLICSMDLLNGFNLQMTTFLHPGDGPGNPMCAGSSGTTAHNPTWFRFIAWCDTIDLSVLSNMCTTQGGCRGIQLAVFSECNWQDPNNSVACEVSDCLNPGQGTSQTLTVNMANLIVGQVYSVLVDGCCNSACNVTITLTSPICPPEIASWTGPIIGDSIVSLGSTHLYEVEVPIGGINFQWYLDGIPFGSSGLTSGSPNTSLLHTWTILGTYELCVDTYNQCVSLASNPPQLCKTIVVIQDVDEDGITDSTDNCPSNFNPSQEDSDSDGVGDICDNCIALQNANQMDTDSDGLGNICDNCPTVANASQEDIDSDGVGNVCDNCPTIMNSNQADCNNNGIGNVCDDPDQDCDGIYNGVDNCISVYNPFQIDQNQNGIGDACETLPKVGINTNDPKTELHLFNGSLYIDNPEKGIILKDYQGICHIIKIINGNINVSPVTCP